MEASSASIKQHIQQIDSLIHDTETRYNRLLNEKLEALERFRLNQSYFQKVCEHEFRITPPDIVCDTVLPKYCIHCELGLGCPQFNGMVEIESPPTKVDIELQKKIILEQNEQLDNLTDSITDLRIEKRELMHRLRSHCTHVWKRRGRGTGCYGYEMCEKFCIKCGLVLED